MESALESADIEKGYRPERNRQETVFDRIDWANFKQEVLRDGKEGKQVRGKILEMLVQADPQFGERTPLERELLDLSHNPEKYGLGDELGHYRNPDMAFLLVQNDDGIMITGVGESKLGLLNPRSFSQLSEAGFARGVRALAELVNNLPDPEKHSLKEIAKARAALPLGKQLLTISPEFTQLLVVPANRNIEWKSTLIDRREFNADGREKFYELLEDTRHVRTARAAFSTAEVSAMANGLRFGNVLIH